MKLEPLFSIQGNKLIKISDNKEADLSSFKKIALSWKQIEIEDESYNEEFLAELREKIKPFDSTNQFVILLPVIDKPFETPEQIEAFINAMNHSARRIKDCTCVAGFQIPQLLLEKGIKDDSPVCNFMDTLAIKHAQYVYFVEKNAENKYDLTKSNFFSSLVLL